MFLYKQNTVIMYEYSCAPMCHFKIHLLRFSHKSACVVFKDWSQIFLSVHICYMLYCGWAYKTVSECCSVNNCHRNIAQQEMAEHRVWSPLETVKTQFVPKHSQIDKKRGQWNHHTNIKHSVAWHFKSSDPVLEHKSSSEGHDVPADDSASSLRHDNYSSA